jgi:hypothetical protein
VHHACAAPGPVDADDLSAETRGETDALALSLSSCHCQYSTWSGYAGCELRGTHNRIESGQRTARGSLPSHPAARMQSRAGRDRARRLPFAITKNC